MRVQQRALKKTGKDSGIRAFISVSTWEISTLYHRVPLCLCLLSSFRVSVEKKGMHSAACKLWGWTLGLCFVSLSGRRGKGKGVEGKKKKKEASGGGGLITSRVVARHIFASHQSKLNNFPDVYESGSIAVNNGERGRCLHVLRRFQFLFQVVKPSYVRIILVEKRKLNVI